MILNITKDTYVDIDNIRANYDIVYVLCSNLFFSNLVIDRLLDGTEKKISLSDDLMEELNLPSTDGKSLRQNSLGEFLKVVNTPNVLGRWVCLVDYSSLQKQDLTQLSNYNMNSTSNGLLVVRVSDFRQYSNILNAKGVKTSKKVATLVYPYISHDILKPELIRYFKSAGITFDSHVTVSNLIYRIGTNYGQYQEVLNRLELVDNKLTAEIFTDIDNYDSLDLVTEVLRCKSKGKAIRKTKVHKVLNILLETYTIEKLVTSIRYCLKDLIDFRILINQGVIPVIVEVDCDTIKANLDDTKYERIKKFSTYKFKRYLKLASEISSSDLLGVYIIIGQLKSGNPEITYYSIINSLLGRYAK